MVTLHVDTERSVCSPERVRGFCAHGDSKDCVVLFLVVPSAGPILSLNPALFIVVILNIWQMLAPKCAIILCQLGTVSLVRPWRPNPRLWPNHRRWVHVLPFRVLWLVSCLSRHRLSLRLGRPTRLGTSSWPLMSSFHVLQLRHGSRRSACMIGAALFEYMFFVL